MIFYLSGTGNTRWLAERLSAISGDGRVVDVSREMSAPCRFALADDEAVGFCFPVHAWRPPLLMRRFIAQLHLDFSARTPRPYCWSVFTQGDTAGRAAKFLHDDLKAMANPLDLQFAASVLMPNTYIGFAKMDVDPSDLAERKLKAAEARVEALGRRVASRETGVCEVTEGRCAWFNSHVIGAGFAKHISDKAFWVSDACLKCGKCAQACPVGNIRFEQGEMPQWKHDGWCMNCFSCYHHCPAHAIGFGSKAEGKGQYYYGKP